MGIKSVTWQNNLHEVYVTVFDDSSIKFVPNDPFNSDAQAIQQWLQTDGNIVTDPPVPPTIIPATISVRQFYQQLSIQLPQLITQDEAYAAATSGSLPDFIVQMIKQIPQEEQFDAKMKIGSVVVLERNNPTTNLFSQLMGWTKDQTDQFFIDASKLV